MRLECGVGVIEAEAEAGQARFTAHQPLEIIAHPAPALIAHTLGLSESDLTSAPVMAGMGLPFTFTELASRTALSRACPDIDAMREGRDLYPESVDFAQAPYWRDGDTVHLRMFAPLDNIPEDPATGSAAAALGRMLCAADARPVRLTLHQGDDMGRPSRIFVEADCAAVTITGQAVRMMEGRLVQRS